MPAGLDSRGATGRVVTIVTLSRPELLRATADAPSAEFLNGENVMTEIKTAVHIFGHLHEPYGTEVVNDILFVNASICDEQYDASHRKPIVFDYEDGKLDLVA